MKPSKEEMALVQEIVDKIGGLSKKNNDATLHLKIGHVLIATVIKTLRDCNMWPELMLAAELVVNLDTQINEIDFPVGIKEEENG